MKFISILFFLFLTFELFAENNNIDQWQDTTKTYKDLINEGFEVKSYDISNIKTENGFIIMFFVTVLQKEKEVFECQEYQTLDNSMETLDMKMVCRKLIQPYQRGIGT